MLNGLVEMIKVDRNPGPVPITVYEQKICRHFGGKLVFFLGRCNRLKGDLGLSADTLIRNSAEIS